MTTHAIKLTSPHELLAVVPYLLGFHPTRSMVLLCLSNNKLGLTQRLDLPRPEDIDGVGSALLPSLITESPDDGGGNVCEPPVLHPLGCNKFGVAPGADEDGFWAWLSGPL